MDHVEQAAATLRSDPEIKRQLGQHLCTDNFTNFLYIGRVYLVVILTFAGAIAFFEYQRDSGISFWWNLPIYLLAIIVVGASQHQLAGGTHEAVHHTLFKNRLLNELASDWLCAFPLFSSTYQFRLYHLAHHQFVNDPERDPDFSLLKESGHWMEFPVSKRKFVNKLLRQIFLVDLIRYMIVRVRYNVTGMHKDSPYRGKGKPRTLPARLGVILLVVEVIELIVLQKWGQPWQILAVVPGTWLLFAGIYALLPEACYEKARLRPVMSLPVTFICQTLHFTLLFTGLAFVQDSTGFLCLRYYTLLWAVPAFLIFPLFLIMRQLIQHGNGDRGWLTNTRVFHVNPLLRYAVFPFGMDYHLPHHMYATVPHYRLRALHDCLSRHPEYAEHCQEVENYLVPAPRDPRHPTVAEVLGPEYSMRGSEVFMDHSVLDAWEVEEIDPVVGSVHLDPKA